MLCSFCDRGIGIVTDYIDGHFITVECPVCEGIGRLCNVCGSNPARCDCEDDEPPAVERPQKFRDDYEV